MAVVGFYCEPLHWLYTPCTKCEITFGSISSQKPAFSSSSTVKARDSQAYRNMAITCECISFTFDPRDMLSLQIGFSLVRAVVVCAILQRTSGLEQSSEKIAPRYLKLVTVPSFCPFTLISLWMSLVLFVINLVFSVFISIFIPCAGFVRTFS